MGKFTTKNSAGLIDITAVKILSTLLFAMNTSMFSANTNIGDEMAWDIGANAFSNLFWDVRKNTKDTTDIFYENINVGGSVHLSYDWFRVYTGVGTFLGETKSIPADNMYGFIGADFGKFTSASLGIEYGFMNYNYVDINLKFHILTNENLKKTNFFVRPKFTYHYPTDKEVGWKLSAGLEFGINYGKTESQRISDSINNYKKLQEKERIENERLAAIEKAKRDSIAIVEKIERERQFVSDQLEVKRLLEEKINQGNIDWEANDLESIECLNGKFGFRHKRTTQFIIPCKYDLINEFGLDGLASVKLNGNWGFIDKTGKEIIAPGKYIDVNEFSFANSKGLAKVIKKQEGTIGYIDKNGNELSEEETTRILEEERIAAEERKREEEKVERERIAAEERKREEEKVERERIAEERKREEEKAERERIAEERRAKECAKGLIGSAWSGRYTVSSRLGVWMDYTLDIISESIAIMSLEVSDGTYDVVNVEYECKSPSSITIYFQGKPNPCKITGNTMIMTMGASSTIDIRLTRKRGKK